MRPTRLAANCPHENLMKLGSSKKIFNWFCRDCMTSVERTTRQEAAELQRSAAAVTSASRSVQSVVRKVAKDPALDNEQAMVIIRVFE